MILLNRDVILNWMMPNPKNNAADSKTNTIESKNNNADLKSNNSVSNKNNNADTKNNNVAAKKNNADVQTNSDSKTNADASAQVGLWIFGGMLSVDAITAAILGLFVFLITGVLTWKECLGEYVVIFGTFDQKNRQ